LQRNRVARGLRCSRHRRDRWRCRRERYGWHRRWRWLGSGWPRRLRHDRGLERVRRREWHGRLVRQRRCGAGRWCSGRNCGAIGLEWCRCYGWRAADGR